MANNFFIRLRRRKDGLHVRLSGEFDGSSAFELNQCLQHALQQDRRVYIHTDSLTCLPAFGRDVFQKQFDPHPQTAKRIVFTGAYAPDMAPEGCATQGGETA